MQEQNWPGRRTDAACGVALVARLKLPFHALHRHSQPKRRRESRLRVLTGSCEAVIRGRDRDVENGPRIQNSTTRLGPRNGV